MEDPIPIRRATAGGSTELECLVAAEERAGRDSGDGCEGRLGPPAGSYRSDKSPVAATIGHVGLVRKVPRDNHFVVGRRKSTLREACWSRESAVGEHWIAEIDPTVNDGDLDAPPGAVFTGRKRAPDLRHPHETQGRIQLCAIDRGKGGGFDSGLRAQPRQVVLRRLHEKGVQHRLRLTLDGDPVLAKARC